MMHGDEPVLYIDAQPQLEGGAYEEAQDEKG
jgi:hypothetical protein